MGVVGLCQRIDAVEERSANGAVEAVINVDFFGEEDFLSSFPSHSSVSE
jgi:hypothetical protein